jgi:hypothetical protein
MRSYDKFILKSNRKLNRKANSLLSKRKIRKRRRTKFKIQPQKNKLTYHEYIHSKLWLRRRIAFYKKFGEICAACGTKRRIQLHHMRYTAYDGTEPDCNLVALCDDHHAEYHALHGTTHDMVSTTFAFIQSVRLA